MRSVSCEEATAVAGGGEINCGFKISIPPSVHCDGPASNWGVVAKHVYVALAMSPVTVPGVIERFRKIARN